MSKSALRALSRILNPDMAPWAAMMLPPGALTAWHRGPPSKPGPYLRRVRGFPERFSYWDGRRWGALAISPRKAAARRHVTSAFLPGEWCGLAVDPADER